MSKKTRAEIEALKGFAKATAEELAALKDELAKQKRENEKLEEKLNKYKSMLNGPDADSTVSPTDGEEHQDLSGFEEVLGAGQGNQGMVGEGGRADSPAPALLKTDERPELLKTDEPGEVMDVSEEGGRAGEDEQEGEMPCGTIKTDYTLDDMNSGAGTPEDEN